MTSESCSNYRFWVKTLCTETFCDQDGAGSFSSADIHYPPLVFTICIKATLFPDSLFIIYLCTSLNLWRVLMSFGFFSPILFCVCHLIFPHSLLWQDVFDSFVFPCRVYIYFYFSLYLIMWTCK